MPTIRALYGQELARCRKQFESIDLRQEQGYLMKYTTFSANIENILPSVPRSDHELMFRRLLLNQMYTNFDQKCLTAGDLVTFRGDHGPVSQPDGPRIYCTYHFGSYRLLTSTLFRRGVDCVLLVGSNVNRNQSEDMTEHIEALRQKHGLTNVFRIVDAGSPTAALTILRELKAGRSLIVFVDGSPETGPNPNEIDQFLTVTLGQQRVLTRKGVGYLSHASGVPIVPVVLYRQSDLTNVIHCLKPIRPIKHSNRDMFCQEAMQQLYDGFFTYLIRYPDQWEGWTYIHSFLEPQKTSQLNQFNPPRRQPIFNENRYTLCDLEQAPILFDRRSYQTYEISEDLRDLLLDLNSVESVETLVGEAVYAELMELEVLC